MWWIDPGLFFFWMCTSASNVFFPLTHDNFRNRKPIRRSDCRFLSIFGWVNYLYTVLANATEGSKFFAAPCANFKKSSWIFVLPREMAYPPPSSSSSCSPSCRPSGPHTHRNAAAAAAAAGCTTSSSLDKKKQNKTKSSRFLFNIFGCSTKRWYNKCDLKKCVSHAWK